jgi:hypothetical protein
MSKPVNHQGVNAASRRRPIAVFNNYADAERAGPTPG